MPRVRLAVLGDPLRYTRSPELHRAGLEALGFECESAALPTPAAELGARLATLAADGYAGVNLTHPLKEVALEHVGEISGDAHRARSINTIGFRAPGECTVDSPAAATRWGDTTDGAGFVDLLRALGRDPATQRVVMHGSGGASRSLALALAAAGCNSVMVVSRDPKRSEPNWAGLGATLVRAGAEVTAGAHRAATLVVNGTPRSEAREPVAPETCAKDALLVDLTYGKEPTAWVLAARSAGREAVDGLGLLVHQARHSIERWTGRKLDVAPLARAVGWPR